MPLNKGHITTRQNIQLHHVPLRDAAALIREISDAGLSSREGCGNTVRNVTADPWAGVCHDELFDTTPYAGAYVRYFVRHPTTQLMPRKVKTAFTGSTDRPRASPASTTSPSSPRERDGVKGFEMRVGGGTSIMPRVAPALSTSSRPTTASTSSTPRPSCASSTARTGCASTARAPASRSSSTSSASRRCASRSRRSSRATGSPSATSRSSAALSCTTRRRTRPPAGRRGSPNGDRREFERFRAANVEAQRQAGFSTVQVKVTRGDLTPEQFRGLAADHARVLGRLRAHDRAPELAPALGARRGGLRRLAAAGRARARRRRRRRGQRRRLVPRHGLLQARHHELDGPQPRPCRSGSSP